MLTARTERSTQVPTHFGNFLRRSSGFERGRAAARSHHGAGRSLHLDIDHLASLASSRGSLFDTAAPERR